MARGRGHSGFLLTWALLPLDLTWRFLLSEANVSFVCPGEDGGCDEVDNGFLLWSALRRKYDEAGGVSERWPYCDSCNLARGVWERLHFMIYLLMAYNTDLGH